MTTNHTGALMIGICGASGSGKSTLARALHERLADNCLMITQDCYYHDRSALPLEARQKINYDEPAAFDHDLLLFDIKQLRGGESITRKNYDYAMHCRADSDERIGPAKVIIFEGIHAFFDSRLMDLMDFKIYIHVDPDICLLRRVKRDIKKRGREIEGIAEQYLTTVKPMFDQHIQGYRNLADIVAVGGGKNPRIVDLLSLYIEAKCPK